MPRRIDVDQRREELAAAVWNVVRERGVGALSVRTVAAEAGLAVGSLRHVFPTRSELVVFSAELMIRRATARIDAVPRTGDLERDALALVSQVLPLAPDSRAELEVNLALIAEAPAVPELIPVRDRATRELADFCRSIAAVLLAESAGRGGPEIDADRAGRRLHALVDGLSLHLLADPAGADPEWALEILRDELAGLSARS
ncbi:TetR/AcrR family transcriptional regulator [Gordonia caeni]|uniref:TetR/AcrR family transcriptional regulator n=1 Tax=Gordonia caeni TaxID=1007097 RepID=A0ABP7NPS5_9ACTN